MDHPVKPMPVKPTARIRLAAGTMPVDFVAFDLLALGDRPLMDAPLTERRGALDDALRSAGTPVFTAQTTADLELAGAVVPAVRGVSRL